MILSTTLRKNSILLKMLLFVFVCLFLGNLVFANSTQAKSKKFCFKKKIASLTVGKRFRYQIKRLPKKAKVSYSSNHKALATIDKKKGILTAKKQGEVIVRAKIVTANKKKTLLKTSVRILGRKKIPAKTPSSNGKQSISAQKTVLSNTTLKVNKQINPWNHSFVLYSSRILLKEEVQNSSLTLYKTSDNSATKKGSSQLITAGFHSLSDDGKKITYQLDDTNSVKLCPGNGTANGNYCITGSILSGSLLIHYEERLSSNEIRGFAFDTNQNALSHTKVSLYTESNASESPRLYSTTHTNQNGYYSFKKIPDNRYHLVFSKEEYLTTASDSFYLKDSIHCENRCLKTMHSNITCKIISNSGSPMSDIPVCITKKNTSLQWQGCTDARGLVSFSNALEKEKKNYTKILYQTSLQTPDYVQAAIPLPETASQIVSDSFSPDEEYILTICPKSSRTLPYTSVSFTFSPKNSYSEQLLFNISLSTIPILHTSGLSIKWDKKETDISDTSPSAFSTNIVSFKLQLFQKDGCPIFSDVFSVNMISPSSQAFTDAVNTVFQDANLRLPNGSYYLMLQPVTTVGHPTHAPFLSAVTVTDGILPPLNAAFSCGTSTKILLTGSFSNRHNSLPCTLYTLMESQWIPIASLQSTDFEKLTESCSKAYVNCYPLLSNHTYRLESADPEICFTGNITFTPKEDTTLSPSSGNTVPSFQIVCCQQDDSDQPTKSDTKEHFHSHASILCNAAFFRTTANVKNCAYAYYQDNGNLCSVFLVNDTDKHLINDKNALIAFYDKLQSGKSLKTSQVAYRHSSFFM